MSTNYRKVPRLVAALSQTCEAWVIGSSVDYIIGESDKITSDFDVVINHVNWDRACKMLPRDAKINSCGGFKCKELDVEIDVWMDDVAHIMQQWKPMKAVHMKSRTVIKSEKQYE